MQNRNNETGVSVIHYMGSLTKEDTTAKGIKGVHRLCIHQAAHSKATFLKEATSRDPAEWLGLCYNQAGELCISASLKGTSWWTHLLGLLEQTQSSQGWKDGGWGGRRGERGRTDGQAGHWGLPFTTDLDKLP